MITEFTCGMCQVKWHNSRMEWILKANNMLFGVVSELGYNIQFHTLDRINAETLVEIAVLMNNIKRQYKQLQNISQNGSKGKG